MYDILQFAAGSIRNLFHLAYYSPLQGIHLKWLLELSSPRASQQPTSDFNQGLIHDQQVETTICQQPGQPAAISRSQIRESKERDAEGRGPGSGTLQPYQRMNPIGECTPYPPH